MLEEVNKLLVTVVIPTYNRADLISRAVASVSQQSHQNLEIIVIDDASDDDTTQVVHQIPDSRVKYICHQTNLGGSEARNTGIKQAVGDYIAFLDSDDVWLPDKLSSQLAAISQEDRQDNLVCYSQFKISPQVFYRRRILPKNGKQNHETIPDYFWLSGGTILTSTLLISRSLAAATLFKSGLVKHQDLDFVIRLEQQGAKFIFIPKVLAVWHNEMRSDRISKLTNYQLSLDWIEGYRGQISERAFKGFILKEVVPKMLLNENTKPAAINLLIEGFRERIISIDDFLFLITKQAIPSSYQKYLKMLLKKTKLIN